MTTMDFRGAAKRLDDLDLPRLGEQIGVGEDELHAFLDVESRGSGFDALGRPKILFEPHLFYANLPRDLKQRGVDAGLAAPKWGQLKYGKESEQYEKLHKAIRIHPEAALKSCSWGLCQVLGSNYRMVGYDSVVEFVAAMMQDEENHLKACIDFLVAAGIDDDLREHRWETVARVYNGPGYRKNNYHTKMAAAYAKWKRIKDTPYRSADDPDDDSTETVGLGLLSMPTAGARSAVEDEPRPVATIKKGKWPEHSLSRQEIETIQKRLRELKYHLAGKIDGKWGPSTGAAIKAFQEMNACVPDGHWGPETKAALFDETAAPMPVSPARASTTEDDLRAQGSRIVTKADNVTKVSFFGKVGMMVSAAFAFMLEYFQEAWEKLEPIRGVLGQVPIFVWFIAGAVVAVYLGKQASGIRFARVDDERQGLHLGAPDPSPSPPVEHENPNARPARTVGFIGQLVGRR